MRVEGQIRISSSKESVWDAVSDIEDAARIFKDIKSIELIDKPQSGLMGTKWKETRVFMGKEATETMWIIEVTDQKSYVSEAKNSGCIYHSSISLEEKGDDVIVTKTFESTPETFFAKLMSPLMFMMRGTLQKCLVKDLEDLKKFLQAEAI